MSFDVECPYCGAGQDINHDDGYGYSEYTKHQQYCGSCNKTFGYTTSVILYYETFQAPCMNDGAHEWKLCLAAPKEMTKMRCRRCDQERELNEQERIQLKIPSK